MPRQRPQRPTLPSARDVAGIAKRLRAEGFRSVSIETTPDGRALILAAMGEDEPHSELSELEKWRAKRGSS